MMNADDREAEWKRLAAQLEQTPQVDEGLQRLAAALAGQRDNRIPCDECLAALPRFVEAEQSGFDVSRLYPEVKRHLDTCPACEAVYADMLTLSALDERAENIGPPASLDLSFLPPLSFADYVRDTLHAIVERAYPALLATVDESTAALLAPLQRGQRLQLRETPPAYGDTPSVTTLVYLTYTTADDLRTAAPGEDRDAYVYQTAYALGRARGFSDESCKRFAAAFTEVVTPTLQVLQNLSGI